MTRQRDSRPALEETEAIGPDEITHADEDWPVPREYRVDADDKSVVPAPHDEPAEVPAIASPRSRRPHPYIGVGLLGVLLAALLVLGVAWRASSEDPRPTSEKASSPPAKTAAKRQAAQASVAVPDVSELEVTQARAILQNAGLRARIRIAAEEFNDAVPGEVLRQAPAAGTDIAAGSLVVLTVSGARSLIEVPELVGLMVSDATRTLRDADLRAEIRLVRSGKAPGTVLEQASSPGTKLAAESTVRLEVAGASKPARIAVPRLIGSTAAEARSRLRGLGLRPRVSPVESPRVRGTVVGQSPSAGARLGKGQTVTLEVSSGPAQVTVPDVIGLDEQSARARLGAAGFAVEVAEEVTTDPGQDGIVVGQNPVGGSVSDATDTVTITVARLASDASE